MIQEFGCRDLPRSGVIYVTDEAYKAGFSHDAEQWANLGQGAPEIAPIDIPFCANQHEYAPVDGIRSLREKVAQYYNELFRRDKKSQYSYKNVSITPGGRAGLNRVIATLGQINVGHFIPDYTAYEELLSTYTQFNSIPIILQEEHGFRLSAQHLESEIIDRGLRAILLSNPSNPTSVSLGDSDLQDWRDVCVNNQTTMIVDEYYSHYVYDHPRGVISIAERVDDVNEDPVIILNGLTKNWCCPGWRIGWVVAPEPVIERVSSAGSFLDGGANQPLQHMALALLNQIDPLEQSRRLRTLFAPKRDYMVKQLELLGIKPVTSIDAGFYVWAQLSKLPEPLRNGMNFFKEGLTEKVITVPGVFFDINPGQRRVRERFTEYCRISFGPPMEDLERGIESFRRLISRY